MKIKKEKIQKHQNNIEDKKNEGIFGKNIENELLNIYSNSQGEIEDVSKLDVRSTNKLKITVYILLFIAVILSFLVFYSVFGNSNSNGYQGKNVDISIIADEEVSSGDDVTYIIEWVAKDKVSLFDTELILLYPKNFTFIEAEPAPYNQYNTLWDLGTLNKGDTGKVIVRGKMIGALGSFSTIEATISYKPENFSSTFKDSVSFTSQITQSILKLHLLGPDKVIPNKKISYSIEYENSSENDLNSVMIAVRTPEDFSVSKTDPERKISDNQVIESERLKNSWFFDVLESGEKGVISLEGEFILNDDSSYEDYFLAQIGFLSSEGNFSVQIEEKESISIVNHNLKLDMFMNGQTSDSTVNLGDTLNYLISYRNLGKQNLKDFKIYAELNSEILDWDTLADKQLGEVEGNRITWDVNSIKSFQELNSLAEGTIEFSIKVYEPEEVKSGKDVLEIRSSASAVIGMIDDMPADLKISTKETVHSVNTALSLKVDARYFNDDNIAVGTGPLPPEVDKKTSYRVFWNLSNTIHEVNGLTVTTKLPENVFWENKTSTNIGSITYNDQERSVSWSVEQVKPGGTFDQNSAWFDISITPGKDQIGKLVLLTTDTDLRGVDVVTGATVAQLIRSLTSNLENDPFGAGRGLVVESQE